MAEIFGVPSKKSQFYAIKYRNIGRSKLKRQKYFEALENFNKSLSLALSCEDISLAYAGRAEVYLKVREFERCLENLKHAKEAGFLLEVLNETESKCTKLMSCHRSFLKENPWSFFKLSYPANKKIPFVANCLEVKNDENFGRYITTSMNLKPGDMIAIEEPFFKIVEGSAAHLRCANCLKSNKLNLRPSMLCSSSKQLKLISSNLLLKLVSRHVLLEKLPESRDGNFSQRRSQSALHRLHSTNAS